ncbi:hypothetical protein NQ314_002814 [Rhamnusium bicolor]|uniref:Uncharacterized protein n=1 Tax=Rhamnusium bicolor TaxID=1586634 RepID=A0AAV8ZN99_9CUCU|nr:hypothetical protein NQ314_002814 [Rhamnusium bicolor]
MTVFHEIATNDLPAIIEAVANITGQKGNIIYIGHSMGTTTSYVYSIVKKESFRFSLKGVDIIITCCLFAKYTRII